MEPKALRRASKSSKAFEPSRDAMELARNRFKASDKCCVDNGKTPNCSTSLQGGNKPGSLLARSFDIEITQIRLFQAIRLVGFSKVCGLSRRFHLCADSVRKVTAIWIAAIDGELSELVEPVRDLDARVSRHYASAIKLLRTNDLGHLDARSLRSIST